MKADIKSFKARVYENRLGEVAKCTLELKKIENTLRRGWNKEAYGRGHREDGDDGGGDEKNGCNVEIVDEAIQSEFWRGMLLVLSYISAVMLKLLDWSESCSCHYTLDWKAVAVHLRRQWEHCACRGMRPPCLANGDMFRDVEKRLILQHLFLRRAAASGIQSFIQTTCSIYVPATHAGIAGVTFTMDFVGGLVTL